MTFVELYNSAVDFSSQHVLALLSHILATVIYNSNLFAIQFDVITTLSYYTFSQYVSDVTTHFRMFYVLLDC